MSYELIQVFLIGMLAGMVLCRVMERITGRSCNNSIILHGERGRGEQTP
jgi:hypothetical protein